MARICFYCGKDLKNGETCNCRQAQELNENKKLRQKEKDKSYPVEFLARNFNSNDVVEAEKYGNKFENESNDVVYPVNNDLRISTLSTDNNGINENFNEINSCNDQKIVEEKFFKQEDCLAVDSRKNVFNLKGFCLKFQRKIDYRQLDKNFSSNTKSQTDDKINIDDRPNIESGYNNPKGEESKNIFRSKQNENNIAKQSQNVNTSNRNKVNKLQGELNKVDRFIHTFIDSFTKNTNRAYEKVKQSCKSFYQSKGKSFFYNTKLFCLDLLHGPDTLIARTNKYKKSSKIIILMLSFFLNAILFWRIAATTSLGKFLDYSNDTGMVFSFSQLLTVFLRAYILSVLFFIVRTIAYKYAYDIGVSNKKSWSKMFDLQIAGYIYSIVFYLFAIILAQGSGVSSFFLLAFAFVVQVLVDFVYLMDFINCDKNRSFQILLYVNFVSLLILAMFIRWIFPSISHYSVISCPWLWN